MKNEQGNGSELESRSGMPNANELEEAGVGRTEQDTAFPPDADPDWQELYRIIRKSVLALRSGK
ncbi:hypothetical protein [Paenibacillus abyssi]|uniref:Uncharacterized protein n=1 Tax=Paenibacillus abyssi TaxID=1340531 RepID=A0A917CSS3_9BACL|nr:hypothetical protein [Paenibacillus abyssi]GGF98367.1 hypothetical protein GCM10010916_14520 [Paenibacillus abyssi]